MKSIQVFNSATYCNGYVVAPLLKDEPSRRSTFTETGF